MRRAITIPTMLAALVAAPLAVIAVLVRWAMIANQWHADDMTPAMWSARTFLAYFDVGIVLLFIPSLAVCVLVRKRLETAIRDRQAFVPMPTGTAEALAQRGAAGTGG
jgi:hypothetical protein